MLSDTVFELSLKPKSELAIPEIVAIVEEMNRPTEIPSCRVCGADLTIGRAGGGQPTLYRCGSDEASPLHFERNSEERSEALMHYDQSLFEDRRHTDPWAYELVQRLTEDPMVLGFLNALEKDRNRD